MNLVVDQVTGLAQVAGQQKRLDARIRWLAAFSQVSADVVVDLSCDWNVDYIHCHLHFFHHGQTCYSREKSTKRQFLNIIDSWQTQPSF